jgi:hypothetical protein
VQNNTMSDVASALTQSVSKDGQTAMTGGLNMGNNGITNISALTGTAGALNVTGTLITSSTDTATAFIPSGASVPTNGLYLSAANTPALSSNSTLRWSVNSTGNHTLATPSAGTAITIGMGALATGAVPHINFTASAANAAVLSLSGNAGVPGTSDFSLSQNGSSVASVLNRANAILNIGTNNVTNLAFSAAGNLTAQSPTSGVTLTVNGFSTVHSTKIADSAGTTFNAGFLEIPQNIQNAAYAPVLSDAGKHIYHSDGTARTYTIPANGTVAYPIGTTLTFVNDASGAVNVTIAITTDTLQFCVDGTTGSRTLARFGIATALKVAATKWVISGTGLT